MLCYSLQENNHITLGSIVYYTILGDTTLTHSDIFFCLYHAISWG